MAAQYYKRTMRRGVLIASLLFALNERVVCTHAPDQSYALFVPSSYDSAKKWPILYVLDARGSALVPMERFRDAAEWLGVIVASSYNSASDESNEPNVKSMRAMWKDTHDKLSIDDKRVFVAGFSGTVRAACYLALAAPGSIAGIIGAGAGFPADRPPARTTPFAFFGTVGARDFNYGEMWELEKKLTAASVAHRIVQFDGVHEWMPAPIAREALEWMLSSDRPPTQWPQFRDSFASIERAVREEERYLADAQKILSEKPPYDVARTIKRLRVAELKARSDDSAKRMLATLVAQTGFYLPREMRERGDNARAEFFIAIAREIQR
jgi:predicted esterase